MKLRSLLNQFSDLLNFRFELFNSLFVLFVFVVVAYQCHRDFRAEKQIAFNIHDAPPCKVVMVGLGRYFQYLPGQFFLSKLTHIAIALKSSKPALTELVMGV